MSCGFSDEQDERIAKVVVGLDNSIEIMEQWQKYIHDNVKFPFKAKVAEWQYDISILKQGEVLKVHSIENIDDKYGIIANTRFRRKKLYFSLCELEALDFNDESKQIINY